jgi:transcriptional accessory protein Tex/SPT6
VETPSTQSTSLSDLKPKMQLSGRVVRLELSGAVIDVGVGAEGMVHISRLKKGRVNRVEEVVQVGQEVEVWVERVDATLGRLDLTMIRPLAFDWHQLRPGTRAVGKSSHWSATALVDIGAERSGLVHVSEMGDEYVARPDDVVKVGDTVEVVVLEADRKKKQIRLSMKGAQAVEVEEEAAEPPPATAMEIALRRAMEGSSDAATAQAKAGGVPRKTRQAQEDLLARTLEQRAKTTAAK